MIKLGVEILNCSNYVKFIKITVIPVNGKIGNRVGNIHSNQISEVIVCNINHKKEHFLKINLHLEKRVSRNTELIELFTSLSIIVMFFNITY